MSDAIPAEMEQARANWITRWDNVGARFYIEDLSLGFLVEEPSPEDLRVTVIDESDDEIAVLEGGNDHTVLPAVAFNSRSLSEAFLTDCYHMARCFAEYLKTRNADYAKGFEYYRRRAVELKG